MIIELGKVSRETKGGKGYFNDGGIAPNNLNAFKCAVQPPTGVRCAKSNVNSTGTLVNNCTQALLVETCPIS